MLIRRAHRLPVIAALALLIARGVAAQSVAAQSPDDTGGTVPVRGIVDGDALVATARRYLGVPYELGGTSPRAFDCSGFVRYVFARHGLTLPRTAHEQASLGRAPTPGELAPGDLLFFYGGRGAQHVALYVGGDTIIHASSSGHRVKLDRLSGEHVQHEPRAVKRLGRGATQPVAHAEVTASRRYERVPVNDPTDGYDAAGAVRRLRCYASGDQERERPGHRQAAGTMGQHSLGRTIGRAIGQPRREWRGRRSCA